MNRLSAEVLFNGLRRGVCSSCGSNAITFLKGHGRVLDDLESAKGNRIANGSSGHILGDSAPVEVQRLLSILNALDIGTVVAIALTPQSIWWLGLLVLGNRLPWLKNLSIGQEKGQKQDDEKGSTDGHRSSLGRFGLGGILRLQGIRNEN